MPFPNWIGRKRLWTKETVLAALAAAAQEIKGPLPCSDATWAAIKKGRLDWPPAVRVLGYFHGMARGWQAVGVPIKRISMRNLTWLPEEEAYLLDKAGVMTLERIAHKLGRSYQAARARLNKNNGIRARDNQGYLSAAELAKEYNCPYHRICDALVEGKIKGHFDKPRHRWQVDPVDLTPEAIIILNKPKGTHKSTPTDTGSYYQRYGLKRSLVNGKILVLAK